MFDRIRKAFSRQLSEGSYGADSLSPPSEAYGPVSQWAATQGLEFSAPGLRQSFAVAGKVGDQEWQLGLGPPSRCYVIGEELRASADLGMAGEVAVLVISRQLKESLQELASRRPGSGRAVLPEADLSEELDWLARLQEVQWDGPSETLWSHYAVLAHRPEDAQAWLEPELLRQLLAWPLPGADCEVPFVLLLQGGKLFLRMEYRPADLPTLQHAAGIFTNGCESALARFAGTNCFGHPAPQSH